MKNIAHLCPGAGRREAAAVPGRGIPPPVGRARPLSLRRGGSAGRANSFPGPAGGPPPVLPAPGSVGTMGPAVEDRPTEGARRPDVDRPDGAAQRM
jgi:hypothetical protein